MKKFIMMYRFNGDLCDLKIKATDDGEVFDMWKKIIADGHADKYEYIYGCTADIEKDTTEHTNDSLNNIRELWNNLAKELGSNVEINHESLIETENEHFITHCTFTTKDVFSAKSTIKPIAYFNAVVYSFFKDIEIKADWVCDGVYNLRFWTDC